MALEFTLGELIRIEMVLIRDLNIKRSLNNETRKYIKQQQDLITKVRNMRLRETREHHGT